MGQGKGPSPQALAKAREIVQEVTWPLGRKMGLESAAQAIALALDQAREDQHRRTAERHIDWFTSMAKDPYNEPHWEEILEQCRDLRDQEVP